VSRAVGLVASIFQVQKLVSPRHTRVSDADIPPKREWISLLGNCAETCGTQGHSFYKNPVTALVVARAPGRMVRDVIPGGTPRARRAQGHGGLCRGPLFSFLGDPEASHRRTHQESV
jgi:hypothetical protein